MSSRFLLPVPTGFNFRSTLQSHGWCMLAPFTRREDPLSLQGRIRIGEKPLAVQWLWDESAASLRIESERALTREEKKALSAASRDIFFFDLDLSPFYRMTRRNAGFSWIAGSGAGRMLRSATFFEDLVKMILTTNCSWALTVGMCENIVEACGGGSGLFPEAEQIARRTERFLREKARLGYRAPYVLALARRVASGEIAPEDFRHSTEETDLLYRRLRGILGIGPYAAENLLKLLGRFDHLGLDSWTRKRFYELHEGGKKVPDARIDRHYASFGRWKGLAFWLDVTRHFYDNKFPLAQ